MSTRFNRVAWLGRDCKPDSEDSAKTFNPIDKLATPSDLTVRSRTILRLRPRNVPSPPSQPKLLRSGCSHKLVSECDQIRIIERTRLFQKRCTNIVRIILSLVIDW